MFKCLPSQFPKTCFSIITCASPSNIVKSAIGCNWEGDAPEPFLAQRNDTNTRCIHKLFLQILDGVLSASKRNQPLSSSRSSWPYCGESEHKARHSQQITQATGILALARASSGSCRPREWDVQGLHRCDGQGEWIGASERSSFKVLHRFDSISCKIETPWYISIAHSMEHIELSTTILKLQKPLDQPNLILTGPETTVVEAGWGPDPKVLHLPGTEKGMCVPKSTTAILRFLKWMIRMEVSKLVLLDFARAGWLDALHVPSPVSNGPGGLHPLLGSVHLGRWHGGETVVEVLQITYCSCLEELLLRPI